MHRITKNELEDDIKEILKSLFIENDIKEKDVSNFSINNKLDMDSIKKLKLLVNIEKKYNFQFDYEDIDINIFENYNELVNYIYNKFEDDSKTNV